MNESIHAKLFSVEQPKYLELRVRQNGNEKIRQVFYAPDGVTLLLFVEQRDCR